MVALVLSAIGKTGPIIWSMSGPANQLLRQLGLLLFLAEVGTSAGKNLVATFQESGLLMFGVVGIMSQEEKLLRAKEIIENSRYLVCLLGMRVSSQCGCTNWRSDQDAYDIETRYLLFSMISFARSSFSSCDIIPTPPYFVDSIILSRIMYHCTILKSRKLLSHLYDNAEQSESFSESEFLILYILIEIR